MSGRDRPSRARVALSLVVAIAALGAGIAAAVVAIELLRGTLA